LTPLEAFLYTLAILLTGYCIGRHTRPDKGGESKGGGKEEHIKEVKKIIALEDVELYTN